MYEAIRYPLIITDDAGYEILSVPFVKEKGRCYFSGDNFSPDELTFLFGRIREYRIGELILLKESQKGRAVFVSPFAFSSTRTLVALVSDIDYDIVASVCAFAHSDVAMSHIVEKKLRKRHEMIYKTICDIICVLKSATDSYLHRTDFYTYLRGMTEAISHMTFCKASLSFEPQYPMRCPDNFDSGILSLYLITMMSAASFASGERSAEIVFSSDNDVICVYVSFSALMDKDMISDFEKIFLPAVTMIDGICAQNNLPMYFYRDGIFKSGIIPCRIENGLIGLKARVGDLKDEEEHQQKERNIFLTAFSSSDEG